MTTEERSVIDVEPITFDDADFQTTDWTELTHTKDVDPNFDEVFEDNTVKRLDIVITENRWQSMLDDMTKNYGAFGSGGAGGGLADAENPIFVPAEVFYEGKQGLVSKVIQAYKAAGAMVF